MRTTRATSILAARRFCYRMMYKSRETYFLPATDNWVGGVRADPASAEISLDACAAAIEAFLCGQH